MEDRERLQDFIDELRRLISNQIIENRHELFSNYETLENADFYEDLVAAWESLQENFKILREEIGSIDESKLRNLGLTGAQFQLKHNLFMDSLKGLDNQYDTPSDGGIKKLKKSFKYGRIIIGTIAQELGIAEPIKEFIEAVEMGIENAEQN